MISGPGGRWIVWTGPVRVAKNRDEQPASRIETNRRRCEEGTESVRWRRIETNQRRCEEGMRPEFALPPSISLRSTGLIRVLCSVILLSP